MKLIAIIFLCLITTGIFLAIGYISGEEQLTNADQVIFSVNENEATISYSFGMTASVPANPCNKCIKELMDSDLPYQDCSVFCQ